MQFVHQALTLGFLAALVPLLIHLINMMRHRRVRWAAMDFLLQSYKKHRKWIWLKQLLLLLMRMAVIVLIVAMLAQLVTRDRWMTLFGGQTTHHYVLLDDSYSMSERTAGASAFERALQVVGRLGSQAANADSSQKFTLIRFSRAAQALQQQRGEAAGEGGTSGGDTSGENGAGEASRAAVLADLNAHVVDGAFDITLEEHRNAMEVTQLAVGPEAALQVLQQLLEESDDEASIVYLLSDFRATDWSQPSGRREQLRELEERGAQIQLVRCVREAQPNLGIVDIAPADDTRAAGVPLFINVRVKNYGTQPERRVQLRMRTTYFPPTEEPRPGEQSGRTEDLPTVMIDVIPPGETVTRRVQVYFPEAGQHVVEAFLPDDAIAADNHRWCVVDFPEAERVLVVDGDLDQRNAYYLSSAFEPGQRARTGVRVDVQPSAFLRDTSPQVLSEYRAVYLADVPRMDPRAVENLESYVQGGGGLGIFVGENVNQTFYTQQLYRDGQGLLPLPLAGDGLLESPPAGSGAPDVRISDHPLFAVFEDENNPLIRLVSVERYLSAPHGWQPDPESTVRVAAQLRNGAPLAVEKTFGQGRVMVFTTTLAPRWNNWALNPSFVVVLLNLQSHLAAESRAVEQHLVGSPISLQFPVERYRPDLSLVLPGRTPATRVQLERQASRASDQLWQASLGRTLEAGQPVGETDRSGIYEVYLPTVEGTYEARRLALNVEPSQGETELIPASDLMAQLDPVQAAFRHADEYDFGPTEQAGFNASLLLMCLLLGLLVGEQALAYFASYHPARGAVR